MRPNPSFQRTVEKLRVSRPLKSPIMHGLPRSSKRLVDSVYQIPLDVQEVPEACE